MNLLFTQIENAHTPFARYYRAIRLCGSRRPVLSKCGKSEAECLGDDCERIFPCPLVFPEALGKKAPPGSSKRRRRYRATFTAKRLVNALMSFYSYYEAGSPNRLVRVPRGRPTPVRCDLANNLCQDILSFDLESGSRTEELS